MLTNKCFAVLHTKNTEEKENKIRLPVISKIRLYSSNILKIVNRVFFYKSLILNILVFRE